MKFANQSLNVLCEKKRRRKKSTSTLKHLNKICSLAHQFFSFFIFLFCSVRGVKKCNFSVFRMVWLLNYKFEFTLQDIESVLCVPMKFYPHCKCKCVLEFGLSFPSWISFFIILFLIGREARETEGVTVRLYVPCNMVQRFFRHAVNGNRTRKLKRDSISGMKSVRLARIPQFTYTNTEKDTGN